MKPESTEKFLLFNVRIFVPELFEATTNRPDILRNAMNGKLDYKTARTVWHIGNVHPIEELAFSFRLGRKKTRKSGELVEGDFVEGQTSDYPSTLGIIDASTGACAIVKNFELAKDNDYLGTAFKNVISRSPEIPMHHTVHVDPMPDPKSFIEQIEESVAVTRFAMWVKKPNTFDVNRDILQPLEQTVSNLNGLKARASITGKNLEKEQLIDASRSLATTGDGAEVSLLNNNGKIDTVKLSGAHAGFSVTLSDNLDADMVIALKRMRDKRSEIRKGKQKD